jgi:hypothetical protein
MPQEVFILFSITLVGGFSVILLWPFMRALAERIRPRGAAAGTERLQAEQDALAQELAETRHDVAELQERLDDFAERLLAKQQDPRIAPPPR